LIPHASSSFIILLHHYSPFIISGLPGTVTSLLRHHRANVNTPTYASSSLQETPLHLAAQEGHADVVKALLKVDLEMLGC
jgi:hypothetical protein